VKPSRGGKSRNLTSAVIKQVQLYEYGTSPTDQPSSRLAARRPKKLNDEQLAAIASSKLEDGDVKGAVRLLCSDDGLAVPNSATFNAISCLHPAAPVDRRSVSSTDISAIQVTSVAVKGAIQSFPNGSSAGPDGLRPQHMKDLLCGVADEHPLLVAVTDLTNLLLEGNTPFQVRSSLFGARLLAVTKKNGGIRPIAVGYVWRRLAAKVACSYLKEAGAELLAP